MCVVEYSSKDIPVLAPDANTVQVSNDGRPILLENSLERCIHSAFSLRTGGDGPDITPAGIFGVYVLTRDLVRQDGAVTQQLVVRGLEVFFPELTPGLATTGLKLYDTDGQVAAGEGCRFTSMDD